MVQLNRCDHTMLATVNPEYITVSKANDLQEIHGITFFILTFFILQVVPRYPVTTTLSIYFIQSYH